MAANYDKIAGVYDSLSRMVFGKSIVRAQVCLLPFILPGGRILIVGGGTGWILEEIAQRYPQDLTIDYIESSAKMIALSRRRNCRKNVVNFIQQPIEDANLSQPYDVIITPFLFDNFQKDKVSLVFEKLDCKLKPNGRWLFADFISVADSPFWQKLLLKIMYFFFRVTSKIPTTELVPMDDYFSTYQLEFEAYHFRRFIRSAVYKKVREV